MPVHLLWGMTTDIGAPPSVATPDTTIYEPDIETEEDVPDTLGLELKPKILNSEEED